MTALVAAIMGFAGLVGVAATLLTLPGIWLMVAVAVGIDLWRPETFSIGTIGAAAGLAFFAEVAEFVAAGAGATKARGAKRSAAGAIAGALIGALVGTPIFPILGTILGAAVGAGVGASLMERSKAGRTWGDVGRVGQGAAVGRLIATVVKAVFAVAVAGLLFVAAIV